MSNQKDLTRSLDRAKIKLLSTKNSVFLTTVLFSLKQIWEPNLNPPTAGVNGKTLALHPDFWLAQSEKVRVSILAHEAWHIAFNHIFMPKGVNRLKYNIAADYLINLMLKDNGYEIPKDWYCDSKYRGLSTMEIYNKLPDPPEQPQGGYTIGAPPPGGLGDDLQEPDMGEGNSEDLKQEIADILVKAATMAKLQGDDVGSMPGEIEIMLDELINPKLDWKTILQNYMNSFSKDDFSFKRPNRRFMPDYYLPSQHSENLSEIAVAVDTSGSVSDEDFRIFLSEINDIREKLSPAQTTIIDFDTSIKHVHKIGADESVRGLPFSGRGGTSLNCVFEHYGKNKPNVLIVFSDLWCTKMEKDPGYPVVWICVDNKSAEVNFGTLIHYDTKS